MDKLIALFENSTVPGTQYDHPPPVPAVSTLEDLVLWMTSPTPTVTPAPFDIPKDPGPRLTENRQNDPTQIGHNSSELGFYGQEQKVAPKRQSRKQSKDKDTTVGKPTKGRGGSPLQSTKPE